MLIYDKLGFETLSHKREFILQATGACSRTVVIDDVTNYPWATGIRLNNTDNGSHILQLSLRKQ